MVVFADIDFQKFAEGMLQARQGQTQFYLMRKNQEASGEAMPVIGKPANASFPDCFARGNLEMLLSSHFQGYTYKVVAKQKTMN